MMQKLDLTVISKLLGAKMRYGSFEPIMNGLQVNFFVIAAPIMEPPVNGL